MKRRDLLSSVAGAAGGYLTLRFTLACSEDPHELGANAATDLVRESWLAQDPAAGERTDPSDAGADAAVDAASDASDASDAPHPTVRLYDTNAVALYFDGSMGPYTGVIHVSYILANVPVTLDFWHGHDGMQHRFTLLPAHFADLKKLKRVSIETSVVEDHSHLLFIDPVSSTYRVPGTPAVDVPL